MPTPTVVQHVNGCQTQSASGLPMFSDDTYKIGFPNGSKAGNCIIVGVQWNVSMSATVTISDDQGNSYSNPINTNDGNQDYAIFYALNVAAGTKLITLTFTAPLGSNVSAVISEFYNVVTSSALDGSSSAGAGTGTAMAAGSFSTGTDGDLIWNYAFNDGNSSGTLDSFSPQSGFSLLSADDTSWQAVQYEVQTSHGSINPTITQTTSTNWVSAAIALKAGSSGSGPGAGIVVKRTQQQYVSNVTLTSNQFILQFPCTGNLLIAAWIAQAGDDITNITDSNGNTWYQVGSVLSNGGDVQLWYAPNATPSLSLTITMTMGTLTSLNYDSMQFYDVSGAATSPLGNTGTNTGSQGTGGNLTVSNILTPAKANGLCIFEIVVESQSIWGISAPSASSYNPPDQNNGWADYYNPDTSTISVTWTTNGSAVQAWAMRATEFQASAGAETAPIPDKFHIDAAPDSEIGVTSTWIGIGRRN
jgi:hypothetical protein